VALGGFFGVFVPRLTGTGQEDTDRWFPGKIIWVAVDRGQVADQTSEAVAGITTKAEGGGTRPGGEEREAGFHAWPLAMAAERGRRSGALGGSHRQTRCHMNYQSFGERNAKGIQTF
jgi:hypothetical protein